MIFTSFASFSRDISSLLTHLLVCVQVGLVIGKGGETIKQLQYQSRARIQVTRDQDTAPGASYREIEVVGTPDAIAKAEQLINDIVNDVSALQC
jgi:far upstream element-binding protein